MSLENANAQGFFGENLSPSLKLLEFDEVSCEKDVWWKGGFPLCIPKRLEIYLQQHTTAV